MNEPKTRVIGGNLWIWNEAKGGYDPAPRLSRSDAPELQECKALGKDGVRLHRSKDKKANERDHGEFQGATIEAIFFISDNRKRDLDGMLTTILDCCVQAGALIDDSVQEVSEQRARAKRSPKGSERVEITIVFGPR